jgi:oligo-1,6-glucosidase
MRDVAIPPGESVVPPAAVVEPGFEWWDRSQSRTPMPWSGDDGFGFTTGKPWLRFGPDSAVRNVAAQRDDPDSVLACYRRMLRVRGDEPSLQDGDLELLELGDPTVLAYRRRGSGPEVLVMIAFGPNDADVMVPSPSAGTTWRPVGGTHRDLPDELRRDATCRLRPFEGIVAHAEG